MAEGKVDKVIDKIVDPIEEIDKEKKIDGALRQLLSPVNLGFRLVKRIAKKTHESVPLVYEQIENFLKSNIITLDDDDKKDIKDPNVEKIGGLISTNLIKKFPNIDKEKWEKIIEEEDNKSFLEILDRALSADNIKGKKDYTVLSKTAVFKKVLIANRGEIAIRVIRACRELGISPVVVYTEPDKNSLAVKFADEAYPLKTDKSIDSYLDVRKIIEIAKEAKIDAIHPGYGFLAENAEFAKLCEENNIKFIGPSSVAIDKMGDKIQARNGVKALNVPITPGTDKPIEDIDEAVTFAEEIKYPVIFKATAGGGGKGMRIARNKDELVDAYNSAQAEAESAFGNPDVFIEKFVENPKHVEFQILGDKYGNIIHLGERDCSVQRRHQKLVEEAPSPALSEELRKKMGEAAVAVAKFAKYEGAGTVEFLLDKDDNFYFMEMNTRIQVEHGVTEMVTGIDLVKEQIKIANGALLALTQDDVQIKGWAIECRINAESPEKDFIPTPGTITNYLPAGGPGIRVCSCSHTGHVISPHYDSMIAKLIVYGDTRDEAIARSRRALKEFIVEGTETTIPFHKVVLNEPNFIKGDIDTSYIETFKILDKVTEEISKEKTTVRLSGRKAAVIGAAVAQYLKMKNDGFIMPDGNESDSWVMAGRHHQMHAYGREMERF